MKMDELGPEAVIRVQDPRTGMRGILVVDNTVLGVAGGGTRMLPDVSEAEVADLARSMTHKFTIFGFPRGGSKAGIIADPNLPAEQRRAVLLSFGRALAPLLHSREVAVGPDMGVSVHDVATIYEGAGTENIRSGLFAQAIDGDPAAYHLTGFGVVTAMRAALERIDHPLAGATVAIEGFGQVGVGTAIYAAKQGARVVAVTTVLGGIYDPDGLDVTRLNELRRAHGDACVLRYEAATRLAPSEMYFLPADVVIPGARPYVLDGYNVSRVQAKVVCPAGNIAVTEAAEDNLHRRGIVCVPDFVANAGAALASWVDFLRGTPDQALQVIDRLIGDRSRDILSEASARHMPPGRLARERVREIILSSSRRRLSFDETRAKIKELLEL